jgi:hypothetical protein
MTMHWTKTLALGALIGFSLPALAAGVPAKLYKNPNCDCCEEYAKYLQENGYDVEIVNTHDTAAIREERGVPERLYGCHSMLVGPYVLEGHIPVETVDRLLEERPPIKGLALPGMPMGTPGMGGEKMGPLEVYYIEDTPEPRVYATH